MENTLNLLILQKSRLKRCRKRSSITYTVAECGEFHSMGAYHEGIATIEEAKALFEVICKNHSNTRVWSFGSAPYFYERYFHCFLFVSKKTAPQPRQAIAQRFCSIGICGGKLCIYQSENGKSMINLL